MQPDSLRYSIIGSPNCLQQKSLRRKASKRTGLGFKLVYFLLI
jgi:hypothetical protein